MKNLNNTAISSNTMKKTYVSPKVEKVALDHEISMVLMSPNPPVEGGNFPTQDPLMSLKAFKLFK
jgi:hypothetical protein